MSAESACWQNVSKLFYSLLKNTTVMQVMEPALP